MSSFYIIPALWIALGRAGSHTYLGSFPPRRKNSTDIRMHGFN